MVFKHYVFSDKNNLSDSRATCQPHSTKIIVMLYVEWRTTKFEVDMSDKILYPMNLIHPTTLETTWTSGSNEWIGWEAAASHLCFTIALTFYYSIYCYIFHIHSLKHPTYLLLFSLTISKKSFSWPIILYKLSNSKMESEYLSSFGLENTEIKRWSK